MPVDSQLELSFVLEEVERENGFHDINQGERFVYSRLMHALMSTCNPMLFKNSSLLS